MIICTYAKDKTPRYTMTVKELKKLLSGYNDNLPVLIYNKYTDVNYGVGYEEINLQKNPCSSFKKSKDVPEQVLVINTCSEGIES